MGARVDSDAVSGFSATDVVPCSYLADRQYLTKPYPGRYSASRKSTINCVARGP
jgi:hypothetical protein